MFVRQVALVPNGVDIDVNEIQRIASALQKQVTRDFAPIWEIKATVDGFAKLEDVPLGYWPVMVVEDVEDAAGVHLDKNGQPFSLVEFGDSWSLTASHEVLEMLADPFGNRVIAGDSPKRGQGRVMFLVEVCDPSEAAQFGYSVNGILVSDFYTPHYFDPVRNSATRYSFTDAIKKPRQVLRGGYLSWQVPKTGEWWQETWFGARAQFRSLGTLDASKGSIRSQIDRMTSSKTMEAIAPGREAATAAGLTAAVVSKATSERGSALQAQIDAICGGGKKKKA